MRLAHSEADGICIPLLVPLRVVYTTVPHAAELAAGSSIRKPQQDSAD